MENADEARVEVRATAGRIDDLACAGAVHPKGEGVDGEITPKEVVSDRRGPHSWERAGVGVGLGTGGDEIEVKSGQADSGSTEACVRDYSRLERGWYRSSYESLRTSGTRRLTFRREVAGEILGEGDCVPFHSDVEVE